MKKKIFYQLKEGKGKHQIICFPYLGGYINAFSKLVNEMDDDIEVWTANPPGHGTNKSELLVDINSLLDLYYKELQTIIKPNCMFFGHSMGGIIAYFLTQKILESKAYDLRPDALILSACNTPVEFKTNGYSFLPEDKLIKHLIKYDGLPKELLNEKALLQFFLPVFRADFKILESSVSLDYKPIDMPVYFMWGENDRAVQLDSILEWKDYFENEINIMPVKDGTHMFINDKADIAAKCIKDIISLVYQ